MHKFLELHILRRAAR